MRMMDTPTINRPQEKLIKYGTEKLTDAELLSVILRTGTKGTNALELSQKVLCKYKNRKQPLEIEKLQEIHGLGKIKACQIIALLELSKRLTSKAVKLDHISPKTVFESVVEIRNSKKEHLVAVYLDTQNQEIGREIISIGTLNANLIHPREIFEPALQKLATGIIIIHNHPSGLIDPSKEDIEITKQLLQAGEIMGINVLDHIIVTTDKYFSFNDNNALFIEE